MRRALVVSCALAVVLGGLAACGSDETPNPIRTVAPQRTASSASPDPDIYKKGKGCDLLTASERKSIAGEKLDTVTPGLVIRGALQCRWVRTLSTPRTIILRVTSQERRVWVKQLPKLIDNLTVSGRADSKYSGRLQAIKRAAVNDPKSISDKEACEYFSLFVEISQSKKNRTQGILVQGTQYGDYTISWQRCSNGVHTELVYEEPGLQVSLALAQAVIRLGKAAHRRALDQLG